MAQKIADFLHKELQAIDRCLSKTEQEIALLQEYRTRLINDVVTGKLDVRDAAAVLPVDVTAVEDSGSDTALDEEDDMDAVAYSAEASEGA
jgi:type I restriction enzyme S subunit